MNILITGAYGFVGSNLAAYLSLISGFNLIALDVEPKKSDWYIKDFTWSNLDQIRWEQIDVIIHLAGIAHDTNNKIHAHKYLEVNFGLTKRIFNYFKESGARKFIFFSSVKAATDSLQQDILTEGIIPNPNTPYGISKFEAEQFILGQHIPQDKRVIVLRPCMIHGPGNRGNLNLIYKYINAGLPYPFGSFKNKRSFVSIKNLNYILEKVIEKEINSGIYNVADNEILSTNEIVALIAVSLSRKKRIWMISPKLITIICKIGDKLMLPFNSERLKKLTENFVVSNRKLLDELDISLPVKAADGMMYTLRSFSDDSNR